MDLLITVSNEDSGNLLEPLLSACIRRGCSYEVFLTHKGVKTLHNDNIAALLTDSARPVIACHDSWTKHAETTDCPVTLGSQTNHSEMMARASRVISF